MAIERPIPAIALLLLAGAASAAPFEVESFRLSPSHPRVLLAPRETDDATLLILFSAGSFDDGERSGLTRLAQHLLVEGSEHIAYEDLRKRIFAAGGELTLETGVRESSFTLTADPVAFPRLAELFLRMIFSPKIDPNAFSFARKRAMHDEARPGREATVLSLVASHLYDDFRYRNELYGSQDVELLSPEEALQHIASRMTPARATVIATGRFDPHGLKKQLSRYTGGDPSAPDVSHPNLPLKLHIKKNQELYLVGYRTKLTDPKDVAILRMVAALLEDRIRSEFRKEGIGMVPSVFAVHRSWLDFFVVYCPLPSGSQTSIARARIEEAIAKLRRGELKKNEFERNQAYLLKLFAERDRTSLALAEELAAGGGTLEWFSPKVVEELRAMTKLSLLSSIALEEPAAFQISFSPNPSRTGAP